MCFLTNSEHKLSQPIMYWEYSAVCRFQIRLWMGWSSYGFLQWSNLSDMANAKPGAECCLSIRSLKPSKTVNQHNAASWYRQWIACSIVSLSASHLGYFEWSCSFQRSSHLPTPHIPHDHFDRNHSCQIGRFFSACCNTDMFVSTLKKSLLCDDWYFNIWCSDIIFFDVLDKCEVILYMILWCSISVG